MKTLKYKGFPLPAVEEVVFIREPEKEDRGCIDFLHSCPSLGIMSCRKCLLSSFNPKGEVYRQWLNGKSESREAYRGAK